MTIPWDFSNTDSIIYFIIFLLLLQYEFCVFYNISNNIWMFVFFTPTYFSNCNFYEYFCLGVFIFSKGYMTIVMRRDCR